jgi:hypothetical protein
MKVFQTKMGKRRWLRRTVASFVALCSALPLVAAGPASPRLAVLHQLTFYWNVDGSSTWHSEAVFTNERDFSSPAMARSARAIEIAATRSDHSLWFFRSADGSAHWQPTEIAGRHTTFSAPAMVRSPDGTEITVEGPGHSLLLYHNTDGSSHWHLSVIAAGGAAYGTPGMVRSAHSTDVAVGGPNNDLDYYANPDGSPTWHFEVIARGTLFCSTPTNMFCPPPAIVDSPVRSEVVAITGSNQYVTFYWRHFGTTRWYNYVLPAPPNFGNGNISPTMVRTPHGTEVMAMNNADMPLWRKPDDSPAWQSGQAFISNEDFVWLVSMARSAHSTVVAGIDSVNLSPFNLFFLRNNDGSSTWQTDQITNSGQVEFSNPAIITSFRHTEIAAVLNLGARDRR